MDRAADDGGVFEGDEGFDELLATDEGVGLDDDLDEDWNVADDDEEDWEEDPDLDPLPSDAELEALPPSDRAMALLALWMANWDGMTDAQRDLCAEHRSTVEQAIARVLAAA